MKSADGFQVEFDTKIAQQQEAYFVDSLFYNGITEFAKESFGTFEEAISTFEAGFE